MSEPGGSAGDGLVGGPKTPQQIAAQRRIQQTQAQVDEVVGIMRMNVEKVLERDQKISELDDRVVDIMRTNVEKVLERDTKLSELDDRADALQQGASQFEQQAGKLKRKYWWKNLKMMIIMGVIGLILIIIIGVWIHSSVGGGSDDSGSGGSKVEGVPTAQPLISLQHDAGSGSGAKGPDVLDKTN